MRLTDILEAVKDVESLTKRFQGYYVSITSQGAFTKISIRNSKGKTYGDALLESFVYGDRKYFTVCGIAATGPGYTSNKWGPLIYDIIVEIATRDGDGLVPAEAATFVFKHQIYYTDKEFSWGSGQLEQRLLNLTSPDAKKHYARWYKTQKSLYGQPIEIQPIGYVEDIVRIIGPSMKWDLLDADLAKELNHVYRNSFRIPNEEKLDLYRKVKEAGGTLTYDNEGNVVGWPRVDFMSSPLFLHLNGSGRNCTCYLYLAVFDLFRIRCV